MRQLGGEVIYLSPAEVGLGKRESAADVARVLGRYVDVMRPHLLSRYDYYFSQILPEGSRYQRSFGRRASLPGTGRPADHLRKEK